MLALSLQALCANRIGSQVAQDEWVLKTLTYKRSGYFVELGAHDGETFSNTVVMEKLYGWSGICVEPNPATSPSVAARRGCRVDDSVLGGGTSQTVLFCDALELGGIVSDPADCPRRWAGGTVRRVSTRPLVDVLQAHGAPHVIDYLSIDVEGAELAILQAFPFDQYIFRMAIRKLLTRHGYRFVKGNDDINGWGHGPIDDFYVWDERPNVVAPLKLEL